MVYLLREAMINREYSEALMKRKICWPLGMFFMTIEDYEEAANFEKSLIKEYHVCPTCGKPIPKEMSPKIMSGLLGSAPNYHEGCFPLELSKMMEKATRKGNEIALEVWNSLRR